jgi:membrane protein required for colicin V production
MNGLDWILIVIALFCVLRGLARGAVSQVFGLAGALGGFLVAAHFYHSVGGQLKQAFPQFNAAPVLSFVLLFFLTWFCVGVVGFWISRALRKTGLAFLDRIGGGIIGFAKALILALILISSLTLFLSSRSPFLAGSTLTPHVYEIARLVVQATPENVQKIFDEKRRALERQWLERGEQPKKQPDHPRKEEKRV